MKKTKIKTKKYTKLDKEEYKEDLALQSLLLTLHYFLSMFGQLSKENRIMWKDDTEGDTEIRHAIATVNQGFEVFPELRRYIKW